MGYLAPLTNCFSPVYFQGEGFSGGLQSHGVHSAGDCDVFLGDQLCLNNVYESR